MLVYFDLNKSWHIWNNNPEKYIKKTKKICLPNISWVEGEIANGVNRVPAGGRLNDFPGAYLIGSLRGYHGATPAK